MSRLYLPLYLLSGGFCDIFGTDIRCMLSEGMLQKRVDIKRVVIKRVDIKRVDIKRVDTAKSEIM